ncbi:MAG TPA: hypothetical protein PLD23_04885 [Armatimonadota bacterium]|nr:hypothetical protein [Armatimonadota bacterium]HQK92813.1 hypothetical protein [Armatimonadota bacterium]
MGSLIEKLFDWAYHVEPLAENSDHLNFRVCFQTYRGRSIDLPPGIRVERGARVVELHQKNEMLARLHDDHPSPRAAALAYSRLMGESLAALARAWREDPRFQGVVAAYGVNLFADVAVRGGFTARPIRPEWRRKLLSWWIRRIVASHHPAGRARVIKNGVPLMAQEVWISREVCQQLYGEATEQSDALDAARKSRRLQTALGQNRED